LSVDVELFGQLAGDGPRRRELNLAQRMTAQEVAIQLGLDPKTVGLVVIDGVLHGLEDAVPPDCRLCFFPPLSGG